MSKKWWTHLYILFGIIYGYWTAMPASADSYVDASIAEVLQSSHGIIEQAKSSSKDLDSLDQSQTLIKESCSSEACLVPNDENSGLLVFMSSSMPESAWRVHSAILEKLGGRFILRGLPGEDLTSLVVFLKGLRERGILTPVEVDPDLFDRYTVRSVPQILLDDGEHVDRICGNISVPKALEIFSQSGETSSLAKRLFFDYRQSLASEVMYAN